MSYPLRRIEYEEENVVDVLILDINLNTNISGIDLAKSIRQRNKNVYIIFSTGHLEYSLLAYSVKTFDYIAKPITIERLESTLNRLLEDLNNGSQNNFIKLNHKTIINEKSKGVVFMLWGGNARAKKALITNEKHLVLECAHPSPLSAYAGFFGSQCAHRVY